MSGNCKLKATPEKVRLSVLKQIFLKSSYSLNSQKIYPFFRKASASSGFILFPL